MLIAVIPDHQCHPTYVRRDWWEVRGYGDTSRILLARLVALLVPAAVSPSEQPASSASGFAIHCRTSHVDEQTDGNHGAAARSPRGIHGLRSSQACGGDSCGIRVASVTSRREGGPAETTGAPRGSC